MGYRLQPLLGEGRNGFCVTSTGNECIAEYLKALGIEHVSDTGGSLWDGLGERVASDSCRTVAWIQHLAAAFDGNEHGSRRLL